MSTSCKHEEEIIRRGSALPGELAEHVERCEACQIVLSVDRAMHRLASDIPRGTLPPPSIIWLKAELLGGRSGYEAADRPLSFAGRVAWLVTGISWMTLALHQWPRIQAWLATLDLGHLANGTISTFPLTPGFLGVFVFLLAVTFTLMMQAALQND